MNSVAFYYLSKNGTDRHSKMQARFKTLEIPAKLVEYQPHSNTSTSCTLGHFSMLKDFVDNSDKEYGCFLEDDVMINVDFTKDLPYLLHKFQNLRLDLLLVGYLIDFNIKRIANKSDFALLELPEITFHQYPDDLWGTQGYICTKDHAKYIIEKYTDQDIENFVVDRIITKEGNCALVDPMYFIEEGDTGRPEPEQIEYHRDCAEYNKDKYMGLLI